jgi:hypothetical protein
MLKSRESLSARNAGVPSALDKLITELISSKMGINPEQVTTEFIHLWREEKLYPQGRFEFGTTYYGGYNGVGRKVLTAEDVMVQSDRAEAFFRKLSNGDERK